MLLSGGPLFSGGGFLAGGPLLSGGSVTFGKPENKSGLKGISYTYLYLLAISFNIFPKS